MRQFLLCYCLASLLFISDAWAQQRTISGKVTSVDDPEGLPGVNVILEGTTVGTVTDLNGDYKIEVPEQDAVLVFKFVSMQERREMVGSRTVINVNLETDEIMMDELVVTAMGIEKEKRGLGYAVTELDGEKVATQAGQPNVVSALTGKVAGVQVGLSSGMPGSSTFIRMRGSNSIASNSNNQPLFIIDGVRVSNKFLRTGDPNNGRNNDLGGTEPPNRLIDINPDDIESMTVLKGPAAAALYGLDASNGAVIITTKSGAKGSKMKINVGQSYSWDQVSTLPELQDKYSQGAGGAYSNTTSLSWGAKIDTLGTIQNAIGDMVEAQVYDNVTPFFQTGHTSNTQLSVSGGGENSRFFSSVSYLNQMGIVKNADFERFTGRVKADFDLTDKLNVGGSFAYTNSSQLSIQKGSNLAAPLFTVYPAPRTFDLHGLPTHWENDPYHQYNYRGNFDNPLWSIENNPSTSNVDRVIGLLFLSYKFTDWLNLTYRIGVDAYMDNRMEIISLGSGRTGGRGSSPFGAYFAPSGGRIEEDRYLSRDLNSDLLLTFNKNISEEIGLVATVGGTVIGENLDRMYVQGTGFAIGGFNDIRNASSVISSNVTDRLRRYSVYADIQADYKDIIYLGVTARNDWSSTLPKQNNSFFYPSANMGFVFSELIGQNNILSFGKVRASLAQVGQDADIYSTVNTYTSAIPGSGLTTDGVSFPFGGQSGFTVNNTLANPNIKPQNETTFEVGAELNFLNGRIFLDAAYYNSRATDQIFPVEVASETGYRARIINGGEITNKGIEVLLNITPVELSNGFRWDVSMNYTHNRSEVVKLAEGVESIRLAGFTAPSVRLFSGEPYSSLYGSRYLRDANGNIVYDSRATINGNPNPAYGMPIADPNDGVIGNTQPDWWGAITNTFTYKFISLSAQFDVVMGGDRYAGNTRLIRLYGMDKVTEDRNKQEVLPGVKGYLDANGNLVTEGTNDITITKGQAYWFTYADAIDESNVFDASFVRLREVSLRVSLAQFIKTDMIDRLDLTLSGRNLALFTEYPNFDPETNLGGANNGRGFEYMNMPNSTSYQVGLNVTF